MEKYLFWGTFFFAYLINGITGFAGNIFAMPVGMVTIGHEESIVVLNCTGFLASVLIAFTGIKHVVWKELAKDVRDHGDFHGHWRVDQHHCPTEYPF